MIIKNLEVLNSKRIKEIKLLLGEQWGFHEPLDYGFLQRDNDIFLVTTAVDKLDLRQLNVNSAGLYFGELRNSQLRLSIEGSQIIGQKAEKNVVELNDEQLRKWLSGEDIEIATENPGGGSGDDGSGYAIIKCGNDFFGCGRLKEGKLLNFVPKARRMKLAP